MTGPDHHAERIQELEAENARLREEWAQEGIGWLRDKDIDRLMGVEEEVAKLRNALKEEAHWHDRKARELGKQPPSIDRNWRMGVHRERRDAICPLVGWPEGGRAWGELVDPA